MNENDDLNANFIDNKEKTEESKISEHNKNQINEEESEKKEEQNKSHENSEKKEPKNKEKNNNNEDDSSSKGEKCINNINPKNSGRQDKEAKKEEVSSIKAKYDETINIMKDYKKAISDFNKTAILPLMNKSHILVQYEKDLAKKQKEFEEEIKKQKNSIVEKILEIRDNYIEEKSGNNYKSCIKCNVPTVLLIILSICHFLYMMEIHGILFALFREIKRDIIFKFKKKYKDNDKKQFYEYLSTSSITDSSKINVNYFTSFLSDIFISKSSITKIYVVSTILNIIISSLLLFTFGFLSDETINGGEDYPSYMLTILCLSYCLIYVIASLISLYPISIILKLQKNRYWGVIFITASLTIAVIIKNYLLNSQKYYDYVEKDKIFNEDKVKYYNLYHILIMFGGCTLFMIFFCLYRNDLNSFYLNEDGTIDKPNEKNVKNRDNEEEKDKDNSNAINSDKVENNQNKDNDKKHRYEADYILGYLIIKDDFTTLIIKIRGFWGYLYSILNHKTIYIFVINLCSRAQKLKFKANYDAKFNPAQDLWMLNLNFIISYVIYLLFLFAFFVYESCKEKKKENNVDEDQKKKKDISDNIKRREIFILCLILLENIIIFIFSLKNYLEENKWFSYFSIAISGSFNFMLYDYFSFSSSESEYLTRSAIISLAQLIFRIIEFLEPSFDDKCWYLVQLFFCLGGAIFCCLYLKEIFSWSEFFDKIKSKLWCCKKNSENSNENKLNNNDELNKTENENNLLI